MLKKIINFIVDWFTIKYPCPACDEDFNTIGAMKSHLAQKQDRAHREYRENAK